MFNPGEPDVSVVLAARNEEKYLPLLLDSLRQQETAYSVEVLVVDDRSTDRTVEIARQYGARVIPNDRGLGVPEMRNLAARQARGRVILVTDADCAYSGRFVQRMAAPLLNADSQAEATLCLWQSPLERRYDVAPHGAHSRSYRLFVRHAPGWMVGVRWPMRVPRWLALWVRSGFRQPLATIGDRVRTGMILVTRDLFERVGGHAGEFGMEVDTTYSLRCIRLARQTRWVGGVVHYYSVRRDYPRPGLAWVWKPYRRRTDPVAPYAEPQGRR